MARASPHNLALFSLVPANAAATAVLNHPNNRHLVSVVSDNKKDGEVYGLNIGFHIGSKSRLTLATLGRSGADITVEGASISRIQCSFEVHETTEEILLYDRSASQSTQFYGESALPFEIARSPRRVVVDEDTNLEFGFGGVGRNLVQFEIVWHTRNFEIHKQLESREDNPLFARTVDETPTVIPSQYATRIHSTPTNQGLKIRYIKRKGLGKGSFGEVFRAVNADTGQVFAVKQVQWPALLSYDYILLKREVEILTRISHPNIVEYISAQGEEGKCLDIFMELKDGSVQDLVREDVFVKDPKSSSRLLHDILKALDYLTYKGIIHRDVKPENILHTVLRTGGYKFQLADFGLSNAVPNARTYAGSPIYMAPELENKPGALQTVKIDIWSLFVTLAYAMNVGSFRQKPLHTNQLRIKAVEEAAKEEIFHPIRHMAAVDPDQRASAADMLEKLFAGEGRTTPRNRTSHEPVEKAPVKPQAQEIPSSDTMGGDKHIRQVNPLSAKVRPRQTLAAAVARRQIQDVGRVEKRRVTAPVIEKGPRQASIPATKDMPRFPGAFPGDTTR